MKTSIFLLFLATLSTHAQRSNYNEQDLRRLEDKIDKIDQKLGAEEARKEADEEKRLLALPLDTDLSGFLLQKYKIIRGNKKLSLGTQTNLLRQYELGYAKMQDARNNQKK